MPVKYEMSWEPTRRRWWKQYEGKRYVISCRQLAKWAGEYVPQTKEGSRPFANRWWIAKKREIDHAPPADHPFAEDLRAIQARLEWLERNGSAEQVADYRAIFEAAKSHRASSYWADFRRVAAEMEIQARGLPVPADLGPEVIDAQHAIADQIWEYRLSRDAEKPDAPGAASVLVTQWLAVIEAMGGSAKAHNNTRAAIAHALEWLGDVRVESINEKTVEGYYLHVAGRVTSGEWSPHHARRVFGAFRRFVSWLSERSVIEKPRNLDSRNHRFGAGVKAVEVMEPEEVKWLVEIAPGQLGLHLLLMANTGMTQQDVSDLRHDEVDWASGRIKRKRSKTRGEANVPTVDYPLWPRTLELLREHRSDDPEVVLLTRTGGRWVWAETVEGKLRSSDNVASNYKRLSKALKARGEPELKPMKLIRKTSASLLDAHPEFGRYAPYFLGHSPKSMAEKHYIKPSRERFDAAVGWLGTQYGLGD